MVHLGIHNRQMSTTNKLYSTSTDTLNKVEEVVAAYYSPLKKVSISRNGLSIEFVIDLMQSYDFSKQETSRLADISTKTLERHLQSGKMFVGLQSDRLLELAELYQGGIEVFGARDKFIKWLNAKIPALRNTAPKEWLDTHHGITMISDELGKIKHGIFA
jgi:putative toxin-antitoxin system antitoxin component (TIGR02293 family)